MLNYFEEVIEKSLIMTKLILATTQVVQKSCVRVRVNIAIELSTK